MLYHVSPIPGIRRLEPRASTHGKPYVYAVQNLTAGLLFGARQDDFDFRIDTGEDGVPTVYECYPDALRTVYRGRACSVYEVREEGFQQGMTGWSEEWVCERAVPVEREAVVEDLLERLLREEAEGRLILRRYADTPEHRRLVAEHVVDRLIRFHALDCEDERLHRHDGRLIAALRSAMDGHLLEGGGTRAGHGRDERTPSLPAAAD